ncbi:LacI family transcriptional regulator [Microbacteriaceae bacterium MWH-Ta3]|nr:LacI family transcriptional regulator [Microbacteriaceae bacterium MWH-Ta3]
MRTITMEEIARAAGVSRSHVSLAYRNAYGIKPEVREHILAVGRQLGYRHNRIAAQLAGGSTGTIGVYLQDLHNDLFADIFDGLRDVSEPAGRQLVLAIGHTDGSRDAAALETLLESRVEVIVAAGLMISDRDVFTVLGSTPLVSIARHIDTADSVVSDNAVGAHLAVNHLVELGHRRIAFLANPPTDGYGERRAGYLATMRQHELNPQIIEGSYSRRECASIIAAMLLSANTPTAIFAHNDQAALGAMDAIISAGLKPGVDISVVGYDNTGQSQSPSAALTTIDIHGVELGRMAGESVLIRLGNPEAPRTSHHVEPTLVVRATTGPPVRG